MKREGIAIIIGKHGHGYNIGDIVRYRKIGDGQMSYVCYPIKSVLDHQLVNSYCQYVDTSDLRFNPEPNKNTRVI